MDTESRNKSLNEAYLFDTWAIVSDDSVSSCVEYPDFSSSDDMSLTVRCSAPVTCSDVALARSIGAARTPLFCRAAWLSNADRAEASCRDAVARCAASKARRDAWRTRISSCLFVSTRVLRAARSAADSASSISSAICCTRDAMRCRVSCNSVSYSDTSLHSLRRGICTWYTS